MKVCKVCGENKPFDSYHNNKNSKDGKETRCKACRKVLRSKDYCKNREKVLEQTREYYYANHEKAKAIRRDWYANNKKQHRELSNSWRTENLGKFTATSRRTAIGKTGAVPCWVSELDIFIMEELYQQSIDLRNCTGILHNVDHIIPLKGNGVCGLHVPWNLQVITAQDNARKGSSYED